MKKMALWALALVCIFMTGCNNDDNNGYNVEYTLSDIAGEWIWIYENGKPTLSCDIQVDSIGKDGTGFTMSCIENKWVKTSCSCSVDNNIISFKYDDQEYKYRIINCGFENLITEKEDGSKRFEAKRKMVDYSKDILGEWFLYDESGNTQFTTSYDESGKYTANFYNGTEITSSKEGEYFLSGDLVVKQSTDFFMASFIAFDRTEKGMAMINITADSSLNLRVDTFYKKGMERKDYTIDDVQGTWMLASVNGQDIDLENACFIENDGNKSIFSSKNEEGLWTTSEDNLSVSGNNYSIENKCDLRIMFADKATLNMMDSSGAVLSYTKIIQPNKNAEAIKGFWYNKEATMKTGDKAALKWIVEEDSIHNYTTNSEGNTHKLELKYRLFGDILVTYNENFCMIFPFNFGYDATLESRYIDHLFRDSEGNLISTRLYKRDLEKELAGSWIWLKENGQYVSTYNLGISFYNPQTKTAQWISFKDGYDRESATYSISKNIVTYVGSEDYPWEKVIYVEGDSLLTEGCDGNTYSGKRVPLINPLRQSLVGKWECASFKEEGENNTTLSITHIFDETGLASIIIGNDTTYGSYNLYDRLLVINSPNNPRQNILWVIQEGETETSMNWIRALDDKTIISNTLTKVNQ